MIITQGCTKREYSIEELSVIQPSHFISNDSVMQLLQKFDSEAKIEGNANIYVLFSKKKSIQSYTISIAKLNFNIFRRESPNMFYFNKLKGYCFYKKMPVLLYGDIDEIVAKTGHNVQDILYHKVKESGKIIFEPAFTDYNLERKISNNPNK